MTQYNDMQAVIHIRLLCVPALQRALDARLAAVQWMVLTSKELLDAIGKVVLKSSSQAVRWAEFFDTRQKPEENMSDFITRCAQEAVSCEFECPQCDSDITEYVLVRKIIAGISDSALRQEVFRKCDDFVDVDSL